MFHSVHCTSRCERIKQLLKRIVTDLFAKCFLEYNDIFKSAKLLKIIDAYKLKVAIYMFRMTMSGELLSLHRSPNPTYPSHMFETRCRVYLVVPFLTVENIRMNFNIRFALFGTMYLIILEMQPH